MRKQPGFTLAAVLTLALALGANTAIFSLVDAVLLTPPPFRDPGRIAVIWDRNPEVAPDLAGAVSFTLNGRSPRCRSPAIDAMKIPLRKGRFLEAGDTREKAGVAVIDEAGRSSATTWCRRWRPWCARTAIRAPWPARSAGPSLAAAWLPGRRATQVSPMVALRNE